MSDNVTRYSPGLHFTGNEPGAVDAIMEADATGDFVLYTDHAPVEAERDRLRAEVVRLSHYVGHKGDCAKWRGGTNCTCGLEESCASN